MKRLSLLTLTALVLLPLAAQAHARLTSSTPADGSVLSKAPQSLMLVFSEAAQLTALSIQKDDAAEQKIESLPSAASAHFMIPSPALTPGNYTLRYRVLSDDTHIMSGTIKFKLSEAGTTAP